MSACSCGKASCALARNKGGSCPGPHETPSRVSGAATPTSSKFAALRRKIAGALKLDLPGPAMSPLPKTPGISMGSTSVTRATAPATGDSPTSPKLSSYQAIRRKLAASSRFVGLPPRTRAGAAQVMTKSDVAAHQAQHAGATAKPGPALQPSGGHEFSFNPGTSAPLELAQQPAKKPGTLWRG